MLAWLARAYSRRIVNINVNITVAAVTAVGLASLVTHMAEVSGVTDKHTLLLIMMAGDWLFDIVVAVGLHWAANHWPKRWARTRKIIDKADSVMDASPTPSISIIRDVAAATQRLTMDLSARVDGGGADGAGAGKGDMAPGGAGAGGAGGAGASKGSVVAAVVKGSAKKAEAEPSFVRDAAKLQLQRLCLSPLFYVVAVGGQAGLMEAGLTAAVAGLSAYAAAIVLTRVLHTVWLVQTDPRVWREWTEVTGRGDGPKDPKDADGAD